MADVQKINVNGNSYNIDDPEDVEKEEGDIVDTVVNYDDAATPTIGSFTQFLDRFVSGTKVGAWFKNFRAGCEFLLHIGSLVNNCVSDNEALPLAAAQGKVLMDLITEANTAIEDNKNDLQSTNNELQTLKTSVEEKAPTSHASSATTYGVGTTSNYGHLKISDNYTSSAGAASAGVTASSQAVYNAYNTLLGKLTDGSVSKVGTATVGSTTKPIYLNGGTPTALSTTVGSGTQPVYFSSGAVTASTSTVGGTNTPVYLKSGVLTACSASSWTLGTLTWASNVSANGGFIYYNSFAKMGVIYVDAVFTSNPGSGWNTLCTISGCTPNSYYGEFTVTSAESSRTSTAYARRIAVNGTTVEALTFSGDTNYEFLFTIAFPIA